MGVQPNIETSRQYHPKLIKFSKHVVVIFVFVKCSNLDSFFSK